MRSKFWRLVVVGLITWWAVSEWTPLADRNLLDEFEQQAKNKDGEFARILEDARLKADDSGAMTYEDWSVVLKETELSKYFKVPRRMEGADTNRAILRDLERKAAGEVQLGLDLKGGSQFVVELKVDGLDDPEGAVNQAMNVLRKRVDRFGVAEPVIQSMGGNKIIIQIPGISQSKREVAKRNIQRVASLRFQLVDENVQYQPGIIVPGSTNLIDKFIADDGTPGERQVMVETKVQMGGEHVTRAFATRDPLSGAPVINFALDATGAGVFQDVTSRNIGRGLAIVLVDLKEDGSEQQELISAPTIQSAIGARGEITGIDTPSEAREIANVLENPLSTPLKIIEERDVDPSLGADSVSKGFEAAQWGIILVALFMLGYYLLSGLFANVALALNIVILLGVFCYFGSTLTLPGIAGIVLTIGMAVDANVLIFERIREEQHAGKSLKGAIASGYGKAFGTIFDANITTVIASLILYWKGHGPVQGFGITLTIGILTSMFTALVVTRLLFDILVDNKWLKSHPKMFAFVGDTKIDFLKYAKPAFIASWVVIIAGIGGALMRGPDSMLGIDFAGGRSLVIKYDEAKKAEVREKIPEIRKHLAGKIDDIELSQVNVRLQSAMSTGDEFMRVDFPDVERPEGGKPIEQSIEDELRSSFAGMDLAPDADLAPDDLLVTDFESDTYGDWVVTGNAFGSGPTTEHHVANHHGKRVVDTFVINGELNATGELTSPKFKIDRNYLNFMIAGGKSKGKTCVNLLVDGKPAFSATGLAAKDSQGQESMNWVSWNVSELKGQDVQIVIVDQATDDWGYVVVDRVFQSNKAAVVLSAERSSSEKVGASISSEIQTAAIVATILAMFGILVYVAFRYEFSFAIGAVLAIVHDVLMTAGLFFIAGMVTGIDIASGELNAPVVAAFLTIIGFSINDTIVIFDRIREALTTGARGSFADVMNLALNQTLARTIITSGTTLLSTAMLYFFGGVVIHDFAFCLLVGVIVGTYSSIYIACAIVLWKHKGKRPELTVGDIEISPDPVSA